MFVTSQKKAEAFSKLFGFDPKVAFLSHSTFGQPITSRTKHIRDAVDILKQKKVDFNFLSETSSSTMTLSSMSVRSSSCTGICSVSAKTWARTTSTPETGYKTSPTTGFLCKMHKLFEVRGGTPA